MSQRAAQAARLDGEITLYLVMGAMALVVICAVAWLVWRLWGLGKP